MYQDLAKGIGTRHYTSADDLAQALATFLAASVPLQQRNTVSVEVTLRDSATSAAVSICAYKNNPPADSPAISLHLCGALRIGSTILTEDMLQDLLAASDSGTPTTELPNYSDEGTLVLGLVNGVWQYIPVDTSTCGGVGGGAGLMAGGPDGGIAGLDGGGAEEGEAGGEV